MQDTEIRFLGDVQRLTLKPGDIIVLSAEQPISLEVAEHLRETVRRHIGDHKVMILSDGLKVGVLEAA